MTFRRLGLLVAGALFLAGFLVGTAPAQRSEDSGEPTCCFRNPRYSGTCEVTPAEGESCASILLYLNNPNSQGKAYSGGTDVRGGWESVACDD